MDALLLGHDGFIGRHLMSVLRPMVGSGAVRGLSASECNLADAHGWTHLVSAISPSTHLVVLAGVKRQAGDSLHAFESNMRIASSIARALLTSKPAHLLFFSSAAVYGEETENLSISEQTCVEPISWYGIAKFASERLLAKAAREVSVPMASLRPPLVYGPGDTTNSYGPAAFCRAAANGDEVVLWGDGSELREFLYVEDCCRIAAELVLTRFEGVLNPVCGTSCSFRQVLDGVHRIAGSPLQVEEKPRSKPKVNVGFDARRFRDTLPNFRFTSLRDGLLETFSAYAAAR